MLNDFQKAYSVLQECSVQSIDTGIEDFVELYYWSARCMEEKVQKNQALQVYLMNLDKFSNILEDNVLLNIILDLLVNFPDLEILITSYRSIFHKYTHV